MAAAKTADLRTRDTDKATGGSSPDSRLRNMGWEIYSRPVRGPVLWSHRLLDIVRTEAEAREWCDRELKRVET